MEVLFEYEGSRRPLTTSADKLLAAVAGELRSLHVNSRRPIVRVLGDEEDVQSYYLLQRWSSKWGVFVDVNDVSEIESGDKLTVLPRTRRSPVRNNNYIIN